MTTIDRWIIGLLATALCGVLWFLILDARTTAKDLAVNVALYNNRTTALESRVDWLEKVHAELKSDLRDHRTITEMKH